ncbi:hypothetical protein NLX86_23195 [Streptomyces sp. A3M-1-3]|uniref:hypothetical protein n=1 Tax=Streptomyces sp. A3M-1-3 TaxID=2962044 RepID=UPI0020B8C73B|nr:hypothetical protein [Streptomyces sp. A3M-1-3]MCP3820894.1 hypothetical protein [Streptomyces sp. A3M-1-3]
MTPSRSCRAVRAAVFAAACVLLAALGHVLMSGADAPWWAMCTAFATSGAMAWVLAGRERGFLTVAFAVVTTQAALHSGFSLAQAVVRPQLADGASLGRQWAQYLLCGASEAKPLRPADMPSMGEHAHHTMHAMPDHTVMPVSHGMGDMSPSGMLAAHLLAALLCGLWLAHGEQAAFRILRSLAAWIAAPLRLPLRLPAYPYRPRIRVRRARPAQALRQLLLVHAITSRGPPSGIAVF